MLNKTLDITVIILTYNEEIHIRRCLENVTPFAKKVFVVDSPSTERTVEICREFENVEVVGNRRRLHQRDPYRSYRIHLRGCQSSTHSSPIFLTCTALPSITYFAIC